MMTGVTPIMDGVERVATHPDQPVNLHPPTLFSAHSPGLVFCNGPRQ